MEGIPLDTSDSLMQVQFQPHFAVSWLSELAGWGYNNLIQNPKESGSCTLFRVRFSKLSNL